MELNLYPKIYEWSFYKDRTRLIEALLAQPPFHTGEWQSMKTLASPAHRTHELLDVALLVNEIPRTTAGAQLMLKPSLPWAEEHFQERVSGTPHNPPPSHTNWPYAVRNNGDHTSNGRFDHTYPERFWPRFANVGEARPNGRQVFVPHNGIRFEYGDLSNLIDLLVRNPLTRQAYLPVWFPEDTGAVSGQRVPCTLGYHFLIRDGKLSCRYYIRSCDVYRHLINDIYLACRLTQWVRYEMLTRQGHQFNCEHWEDLRLGGLIMHISSLHAFVGDVPRIKREMMS